MTVFNIIKMWFIKYASLILIWLDAVRAGLSVRKFVYQVDLSEHCRRRVMPSVFLGRHVVEANSQILHFSQLDVPYSCYISIRVMVEAVHLRSSRFKTLSGTATVMDRRVVYHQAHDITESGSNIILVTQVSSQNNNEFTCSDDENQVLVYEFGETFGGYWGPIPDSVLKHNNPSSPVVYTVASRPPTTTTANYDYDYNDETTTASTNAAKTKAVYKQNEGDFIRIEVPLMNVSGRYVESDSLPERAFEFHENFDLLYDVAPKPGVEYSTSVMPVVQFGMQSSPSLDKLHVGGTDFGASSRQHKGLRFQLDYDIADFTPDPRLTFSYSLDKTAKVRNYLPKKGAHFTRKSPYEEENVDIYLNDTIDSTTIKKQAVSIDKTTKNIEWDDVEQLMKSLTNTTGSVKDGIDNIQKSNSRNISDLLLRMSNVDHNSSAYLASNWSLFNNMKTNNFEDIKTTTDTTTKSATPILRSEDLFRLIEESSEEVKTSFDKTITNNKITNINKNPTTLSSIESTTATTRSLNKSSSKEVLREAISMVNDTHPTEFDNEFTDDDSYITVTDEETHVTPTKNVNTENEARITTIDELDELVDRRAFNPLTYDKEGTLIPPNIDVTSKIVTKVTTINNSTFLHVTKNTKKSDEKRQTGPMVDHKSFENVVKAAPVMADILATNAGSTTPLDQNQIRRKKRRGATKSARPKRYVSVIPIEGARPHSLTQGPIKGTTMESVYHFYDRQDFEQLVELQDDGIYGHMVLRYMRRYVGAVLFNLCKEHAEFNVYLFNASRIVLAINNFTLKRMTVVATPARTMVNSGGHCPDLYLECQIKGARVCVDTVTACDGVPNCGAWEIYDEDRLYCGADKGNQQNVYLTALTFLAVMMTSSYTVYYWLRRCVPKVSDAFFIYTDGIENVLYLDTVMRSHNDIENASKIMPNFYYYTDLDMVGLKPKETTIQKIISFFRNCCRKKTTFRDSGAVVRTDSFLSRQMKMFSFSEVELKKMNTNLSEIGVQTGDSLEMQLNSKATYGRLKRQRHISLQPYQAPPIMTAKCKMEPVCSKMRRNKEIFNEDFETGSEHLTSITEGVPQHASQVSELNMMKFFKAVRSGSIQGSMPSEPYDLRLGSVAFDAETELRNTIFDQMQSIRDDKLEKRKQRLRSSFSSFTQTEPVAGPSGNVSKRLRFVEQQPSDQEHDDEDHEHGKDLPRRFWGVGKPKAKKKTTLPFMPR